MTSRWFVALNPALQSFDQWLTHNKHRIPLE
jgi:hypothetical protein